MLGAIVYILKAKESGWLPDFTGRVMHGVLFRQLQQYNPALAEYVHDKMEAKPFTVSVLEGQQPHKYSRGSMLINKGDCFTWRVTALHDAILQAMCQLVPSMELQANKIPMTIEQVFINGQEHDRSGVLEVEQLLGACLSEESISTLTLDFLSPTTFRVDKVDYPLPLPHLVFKSLAGKWQDLGMQTELDMSVLEDILPKVGIQGWQGRTKSIYLTEKRGINTFQGIFTYNLESLELEERRLLLLLAQFGVFAGCGRMSSQGLGQLQVKYK